MPANKNHFHPGQTGKNFDHAEDLNPGRIDDSWPVDSNGNKECLPPSSMDHAYQMPMKRKEG